MSGKIRAALAHLTDGHDLTRVQMTEVVEEIAVGGATPAQVAGLLIALRVKGETADELAGAVAVMRRHALRITVDSPVAVDTCGTGGDGTGTFNISTAAAFVAVAAGAVVAKHGNRSVSSRCGSADVLEALGVAIGDPADAERSIRATGFGFLFAPAHHPAFKAVGPVRAELGVRTIFNLIGPLANPAGVRRQIVGVYAERLLPLVAGALARLDTDHALVVHGGGMDEIAVTGTTEVAEVRGGEVTRYSITPEELGLARWTAADLAGGDATENAGICRDVLGGRGGAPRDAVLANAGAALYVAGIASSIADGTARAAVALDDGAALRLLETVVAGSRAR